MAQPILETSGLTIQFGGHVAVNGIDFSVQPQTFTSIIGPNGAGKTTFFNLLSGQLRPTAGTVKFNGRDITGLPVHERTKLGIGRSFQITNVFPNLTVLENVRMAAQAVGGGSFRLFSHYKRFKQYEVTAMKLLAKVHLDNKADQLAKNLSHGDKRKLEIAILLALEPKMLLLDEPTAGMSLEEVPSIIEVIRELKSSGEHTILLIEHKIDMVLDLSDSLAVLFNGRLLTHGTPDEIMSNELVQTAYLGGLYDDAATS
ncbi:ABC transporter ATP-binding protein [Tumebacillus permanentifrigoris]|uniref:Amino acid/amide ABC transporter ATP-binding protein 1 (HAAT family) n=1 Tax=Tumebacillus permanentifrigoris TaxID=378543 RepID=A0A316DDK8_9BACL|nr:ABC transporter ATP-binding protein [Tumebacillus permanentifrigoris]PWK15708.1 amino acid/amide ABC transporter ATP-binding protein 1 (HAAT family) [Tumebacillus permanentifrigoris]